jgi:preprotein translocase subunit YajC
MFAAMFAVLYFIMIRPQQKQQKRQRELIASLRKGDEVILTSGIIGTIYTVDEKLLTIDIGDKTRLKVLKQAVHALKNSNNLLNKNK